jgi:hypothetical protein
MKNKYFYNRVNNLVYRFNGKKLNYFRLIDNKWHDTYIFSPSSLTDRAYFVSILRDRARKIHPEGF